MLLGVHVSIKNGFDKMLTESENSGYESIQFFAANPRAWSYKKLDLKSLNKYLELKKQTTVKSFVIHMPYIPNLATTDVFNHRKSVSVLKENLDRARLLKADYLVTHPGSSLGADTSKSISQIAAAINIALSNSPSKVKVLIENTAGQGTEIGMTFKQLFEIIKLVKNKKRIGICLDTAHMHAAGYDLSNVKSVKSVIKEIQSFFDIKIIKAFHLNNTNIESGKYVDRHENIGYGIISKESFQYLINHRFFKNIPGILETPERNGRTHLEDFNFLKQLI